MEEVKTNAGQGLGIAGLVLGIITIPLAIMGCTFMLAMFLGIAGIVLSAVGLSQAGKSNGTKGLPVAGLAVSATGTAIALIWGLFFATVIHDDGAFWKKGGVKILDEIKQEVEQGLEDAFDEMDSNMEDIGNEFEEMGDDLEKKLEDLEYDEEWKEFKWEDGVSDEEFNKILKAYDELILAYAKLVEKTEGGDLEALTEYALVSAKAVSLATKIKTIAPHLTDEQKEKFEELQEKYEDLAADTK